MKENRKKSYMKENKNKYDLNNDNNNQKKSKKSNIDSSKNGILSSSNTDSNSRSMICSKTDSNSKSMISSKKDSKMRSSIDNLKIETENNNSWNKNDIVIMKIKDMTNEGEGVGKVNGFPFFVKDAIIGDVIEATIMKLKKSYGYAKLSKILQPSENRVVPKCDISDKCGGCQIQAMSYEAQLQFKQDKVENNLRRIGKFETIPIKPIIGMDSPFHYRNKAQYPVGKDKEGRLIAGFYAGRTHSIIPNTNCAIGAKENEPIIREVLSFMEEERIQPYDEETGKGLVRHILIRVGFTTKEIMVCLIINGKKLPKSEKFVERLSKIPGMKSISINRNEEKTNVILGSETEILWGSPYIIDYIGDVAFQISPLSFYQVNPIQTKVLYETALSYARLSGKETVWDLYCGIGTISLFLAKKAKMVYGVEIVPQAIEDAKNNAKLNGIENVEFCVGKAEEVLPDKYEKEQVHADVIVVDPPRKGCETELLDTILKMQPKRVVYVSCDSATLARDLRYLCDGGYELKKVQPVDMFGHTGHVETIVALHRKDT